MPGSRKPGSHRPNAPRRAGWASLGDGGGAGRRDRPTPYRAAVEALVAAARPLADTERVPLARAAGRVLAEDVVSAVSVPAADNAAVDGVAFRHADLAPAGETRFTLAGRAAAGHPFAGALRAGEAVAIYTGAPMPVGADTVALIEECRIEGRAAIVPAGTRAGANRRRRGEDVTEGQTVLSAGRRLRAQDVAMAAGVGRRSLVAARRLRVAVFSTGDEVVEPGRPKGAAQIFDANRFALIALARGLGARVSDLGILPDRARALRAALVGAARDHDVLVTSGGVSMGAEDHLKAVFAAEGRLALWRLAVKPGRPLAVGEVQGTPALGLPGNPVAAVVTFMMVARPILLRMAGVAAAAVWPAAHALPAAFDFPAKKEGRTEWLRGRRVTGADGRPAVDRFPFEGSGILSSLVAADGLIELADDRGPVRRGEPVSFLPFTELDG